MCHACSDDLSFMAARICYYAMSVRSRLIWHCFVSKFVSDGCLFRFRLLFLSTVYKSSASKIFISSSACSFIIVCRRVFPYTLLYNKKQWHERHRTTVPFLLFLILISLLFSFHRQCICLCLLLKRRFRRMRR